MPERSDAQPRKTVKIPFDSLTLRAVVGELRDRLLGGQIQDVRQPEPLELQLGIRSQNRNFLLLLSADAQFARAHLTRARKPNAPSPPTFCMMLRKHIENAVITDIRQRGFDRILEITIGRHDEELPRFTLIAELMGKHSNVILVNAEGTILDSMKRVSHRINRVRETLPGLPYQSPPEQSDRVSPFEPDSLAFLEKELGSEAAPEVLSETLLISLPESRPFLRVTSPCAPNRTACAPPGTVSSARRNPTPIRPFWRETPRTATPSARIRFRSRRKSARSVRPTT